MSFEPRGRAVSGDEAAQIDSYVLAMEHLVAVVQRLSLAHDLDGVMAIVRRAARDLTGADGATFILREGEQCFYADEDAIAPLWKGRRFPLTACISGWSMVHRAPAVIEDVYADSRIPHEAYRRTFVKSLVMVPIRTLDPIGAIGSYWKEIRQPRVEEVKILHALADTTAVALENVRAYSELERRVRERTAELEAANADLDSFARSVSHDLRAPARGIAGFCSLLLRDHADVLVGEAERKLNIIKAEAERMGTLIEDLLALARSGRTALARVDLDMTALARRVFERLEPLAAAPNVQFALSELPSAVGDPSLLQQVWTNLLSNALKYSAKSAEPVIEVVGHVAGGEHVFEVRDNGVGFDPQHVDRLFQPFQRLHSEQEFPGTGVGLALVHKIVTRHGGRVWASGVPGGGATFGFALPTAGRG